MMLMPKKDYEVEHARELGDAIDTIAVSMPPGSEVGITIGVDYTGLTVTGKLNGVEVTERAKTWQNVIPEAGEALWRVHETLWKEWQESARRSTEARTGAAA